MILLLSACAKEPIPTKNDSLGSPEAAYRQFMLANLEGSEAKIRPLIVDQAGVEALWRGPYPPEVAKLLAAQYRAMEIVRVAETPQKVSLQSTTALSALDVVFDGSSWRVDPLPIIEFRKRAAKTASP